MFVLWVFVVGSRLTRVVEMSVLPSLAFFCSVALRVPHWCMFQSLQFFGVHGMNTFPCRTPAGRGRGSNVGSNHLFKLVQKIHV